MNVDLVEGKLVTNTRYAKFCQGARAVVAVLSDRCRCDRGIAFFKGDGTRDGGEYNKPENGICQRYRVGCNGRVKVC